MGANARRRREAKNRARDGAFRSFVENVNVSEFNRMMRPACSECGSLDIEWSTLGDVANGPERFAVHAREVLPILGASADAWSCAACGGFGAFEQTLHSSLDD